MGVRNEVEKESGGVGDRGIEFEGKIWKVSMTKDENVKNFCFNILGQTMQTLACAPIAGCF